MEEAFKNILRKNRPEIVEELANDATAKSMVDLLIKQNVLTRNEKSDVLSQRTDEDKIRSILDHIQRKPGIFNEFLIALRHPTVNAVALSNRLSAEAGVTLSTEIDSRVKIAENAVEKGSQPATTVTQKEISQPLPDDEEELVTFNNYRAGKLIVEPMQGRPKHTAYPMTKKRRGIFLLFNNETFNEPTVLETRTGTARDEEALVELFSKLHFEPIVFRNVTLATITQALLLFAMDDVHADSECVVVAALSHGNQEGIYMRDGEVMSFSDIITSFQTCDTLKNKPKLFLFQACRVGTSVSDTNTPNITLPEQLADTLVAYSTVPGFPSYRFKLGSAFIQSLIRVFSKKACREDVATMIADVNARVRERMKSLVPPIIQIVENKSTLDGKWFLNPDYVVTTNE